MDFSLLTLLPLPEEAPQAAPLLPLQGGLGSPSGADEVGGREVRRHHGFAANCSVSLLIIKILVSCY